MTQEKPEDRKATAPEEPRPEEPRKEVPELDEKFWEGRRCPCLGEEPKRNPRMMEPWINFEL